MEIIHELSDAVLTARQQAKIKLRWPIDAIEIVSDKEDVKEAVDVLGNVLLKMVNAKRIASIEGETVGVPFSEGTVKIAKELSNDLLAEALASELIRRVQETRKKAGMNVDQKIKLTVNGHELLDQIKDMVSGKVNAVEYSVGDISGEYKGDLDFQGTKIEFGFDAIEKRV